MHTLKTFWNNYDKILKFKIGLQVKIPDNKLL